MSNSSIRPEFAAIYEVLPEDAKRILLEQQLLPLLDGMSSMDRLTVLAAAQTAQARYAGMPHLDLAAKQAEVEALFDELKRDSNRGPTYSSREGIEEEVIDSLASWLSDIWQVVYEYGVDVERGHKGLLFCSTTLQRINNTGPGCKCGLMNMYLPVTIKNRSGKTVKHFSYSGAHFLEDAFLWIWREMLLKILADGKTRDIERIPQMLQDIQAANMEWMSLDRMLVAGGKIPPEDDEDTDYEEEDHDDDVVHCANHAAHWPSILHAQLPALRTHISDALLTTFKITPSQPLYASILSIAPEKLSPLLAHLRTAVTRNPAAAVAALNIHTLNRDAISLIEVLDAARPILRPRDAPALQGAVHFLLHTHHVTKALEIVSRELTDCIEIMRGVVVGAAFGGVEKEESKEVLGELLKLRLNTNQRQERVERWVDSVATGPPPSGNPLTFAAFLMGFPAGFEPEDVDEPDPFIFSGIKDGDPDFEDLREEWRPRLKERFDGWVKEAEVLKPGGPELLTLLAKAIGETMPYTRGSDIVDEMIARIQDKPTKYHICEALDALSVFMKTQRKKQLVEKTRAEKRRRAAGAAIGGKRMKGGGRTGAVVDESSGSGSSVQPHAGPSMLAFGEDPDEDEDGDEDMPPLEFPDDMPPLVSMDDIRPEPMDDMPPLEPMDDMTHLELMDDIPPLESMDDGMFGFEPVDVMPGLEALD